MTGTNQMPREPAERDAEPRTAVAEGSGHLADRHEADGDVAEREHDATCDRIGEGFWYCSNGQLTGPCEDDECGGTCEYKGACDCWCHDDKPEGHRD